MEVKVTLPYNVHARRREVSGVLYAMFVAPTSTRRMHAPRGLPREGSHHQKEVLPMVVLRGRPLADLRRRLYWGVGQ